MKALSPARDARSNIVSRWYDVEPLGAAKSPGNSRASKRQVSTMPCWSTSSPVSSVTQAHAATGQVDVKEVQRLSRIGVDPAGADR